MHSPVTLCLQGREAGGHVLWPQHRAGLPGSQQKPVWEQDEAVHEPGRSSGQHVHPVPLRWPRLLHRRVRALYWSFWEEMGVVGGWRWWGRWLVSDWILMSCQPHGVTSGSKGGWVGVVREERVGVESLDETGVFLLLIIGGNIDCCHSSNMVAKWIVASGKVDCCCCSNMVEKLTVAIPAGFQKSVVASEKVNRCHSSNMLQKMIAGIPATWWKSWSLPADMFIVAVKKTRWKTRLLPLQQHRGQSAWEACGPVLLRLWPGRLHVLLALHGWPLTRLPAAAPGVQPQWPAESTGQSAQGGPWGLWQVHEAQGTDTSFGWVGLAAYEDSEQAMGNLCLAVYKDSEHVIGNLCLAVYEDSEQAMQNLCLAVYEGSEQAVGNL